MGSSRRGIDMNDYVDSAERHFLGALEMVKNHPATASHCFGISAECVLKAIMCNLQPQPKKVSRNHLGQSLWAEFANHQAVHAFPNRVIVAQKFQAGIANWDVQQRYLNRSDPLFGESELTNQQQSARGLMGLLQMIQKGLI